MSKRAIIYARVSQDVQRDNYSVPSQVAACLRHASEAGYAVVGSLHVDQETGRDCVAGPRSIPAFVDDYTGTELLRPNISTMLTFLRDDGADAVVVLSLDRLARDPYIRQTLEREIEALGARVIYVQGNYAETPEGEIHKDLDGAFAKWENMKRLERSNRGKIAKAERGLFVSGLAPYGYRMDKQALGGLAVCEEEAQVVRHIFDLYVKDWSIRQIAKSLTDEGIMPMRGQTWPTSSVWNVLRNTAYVGRVYFNKRQTIITGDGITQPKRRKKVAREPGEAILIAITPLVDAVIFDRAQRRLDHNREVKRRKAKRFYLLSGMVTCDNCHKVYAAATSSSHGRQRSQYRHAKQFRHCRNHAINAEILEPAVWEGVLRVLLDPAELAEGIEAALADTQEKQARARTHLETLRSNLEKLDRRKANYMRMYADEDMTRDEYHKQRAEVDRERAEIVKQVDSIEEQLADTMSEEELTDLHATSEEMRSAVERGNLSEEEKRELLLNLRVRVTVLSDEKATVAGVFDPFTVSLLSSPSTHAGRCASR